MGSFMKAFFNGSLDLFARWPGMPEKDEQEPGWAKDARALQKDWENLGQDTQKAMIAWKKLNKKKLNDAQTE